MKKILKLMIIMALTGNAYADDMSDANRLYANKDYAKALPLFTKLANAGSADAQTMLGEMYWFGDGVAIDIGTAEQWFAKAANGGNAKARQFNEVIAQRKIHAADIAYYTKNFDGRDVRLANYNCVQPEFPQVSKTKAEVNKLTEAANSWQACYNRFVTNFNAALPAGTTIPREIGGLMNDQEMAQAVELMDARYKQIAEDTREMALNVNKSQTAWRLATENYISTEVVAKKLEQDRIQQEAFESRMGFLAKQSGPMANRKTN
ncbi:tetratricopeptide repeat protein [Undibacterium sp. TJN19]|uniref:tetratricopeptide repeat protein n=1 Tax=Undibacterium sp. TJN19 TaxID=3413055 RepID=UPI003BF08931